VIYFMMLKLCSIEWLMNNKIIYERKWSRFSLQHYFDICLNDWGKPWKSCQDCLSLDWDLNPEPPKYEARVLMTTSFLCKYTRLYHLHSGSHIYLYINVKSTEDVLTTILSYRISIKMFQIKLQFYWTRFQRENILNHFKGHLLNLSILWTI
jgi:hypothetical protein